MAHLNQPHLGWFCLYRKTTKDIRHFCKTLRENVCNVMICWTCILMKCERHIIRLDKVFRAVQAAGMIYYFTLTNDNFSLNILLILACHTSSWVAFIGDLLWQYLHFGRWLLFNKHFWLRTRNTRHESLLSSKHEKENVLSENLPDRFLTCADNGWSMQDPCRVKCFAKLTLKRLFDSQETSKYSLNSQSQL